VRQLNERWRRGRRGHDSTAAAQGHYGTSPVAVGECLHHHRLPSHSLNALPRALANTVVGSVVGNALRTPGSATRATLHRPKSRRSIWSSVPSGIFSMFGAEWNSISICLRGIEDRPARRLRCTRLLRRYNSRWVRCCLWSLLIRPRLRPHQLTRMPPLGLQVPLTPLSCRNRHLMHRLHEIPSLSPMK
jgi:hypothetical protein